MRAALDHASAIEHDDLIGHAHGGESVRDHDRDLILGELAEPVEDLHLGLGVHRCGGLVEHEDVGVAAHERARERDLLPLTERELATVLEPLAELRVVRIRQRLDDRLCKSALGRIGPAFTIGVCAVIAGADVLADGELVAHEVLEDDADPAVQHGG